MVPLPQRHPSEQRITSSAVTWHAAEPLPQKANVGSMPPTLKIHGSALIPHSFSVSASSAFASLFIQQREAIYPFQTLRYIDAGQNPASTSVLASVEGGSWPSAPSSPVLSERLPRQAGSAWAARPASPPSANLCEPSGLSSPL